MPSNTSQKSPSVLLIFLLLVLTFPLWIGLLGVVVGGVAGIVGGVFGTVFGALGGALGAVMGLITWPFKLIFGHGHWFPHFNSCVIAGLIILTILLARRKSKSE